MAAADLSYERLFELDSLERYPLPTDEEVSPRSLLTSGDPGEATLALQGSEVASLDLSGEEYRALLGKHLEERKQAALEAAVAARIAPIPAVALRPPVTENGHHEPTRRSTPGSLPIAPSAHLPNGSINSTTWGPAQQRRLRMAKQKLKEAEAMKRQGDPEAAQALADATAAMSAAVAPALPPVLHDPATGFEDRAPSIQQDGKRSSPEVLDLGSGIRFAIPPLYDELAPSLGLPQLKDVEVDDGFLMSDLHPDDVEAFCEKEQEEDMAQQARLRAVSRRPLKEWGVKRTRNVQQRVQRPPANLIQALPPVPAHEEVAKEEEEAEEDLDASFNALRERHPRTDGMHWVLALPAVQPGLRDEEQPRRRRVPAKHVGEDVPLAGGRGARVKKLSPLVQEIQQQSGVKEHGKAREGEGRSLQAEARAKGAKMGMLPVIRISRGHISVVPREQEQKAPVRDEAAERKLAEERQRQEEERARAQVAMVAREEFEKVSKAWVVLVRRDLPRWHRQFLASHRKQLQDTKRAAELCQREVRNRHLRSLRLARQAPMRARRLARDAVIYWKKVDKEQAEQRKREEKDALESRRREEELREARRQQQRLNFLLTQTELYSHFMQTKLVPGGAGAAAAETANVGQDAPDQQPSALALSGPPSETPSEIGEDVQEPEGSKKVVISEEEKLEMSEMQKEAVRAAEAAASQQWQRTNAFDSESSVLRQAPAGDGAGVAPGPTAGGGLGEAPTNMDLLNPSTMPAASSVSQPQMFKGRLKEYQLKGLQWLVNLYEQGLNGILADEMGLGKTIQAMSFLAHLAEEKGIWGPFLVIAPASVLSNWADEMARFLPDFKVLPYWGALQERTVLRKNINPKRLYRRDAAFHALITSYQLMVADEKYFRRVKWQYMVLDEAQAIKSAASIRWKTLLSFNCRNRLLLTGTPIQNSMAELWALLHFIMPTLFDSHEQFNEWFSKGIEGHAEHGGTLNEHQLTRLHSILKPFMLRRVKRDVESEMTGKKEVVVYCKLSSRQQELYKGIKNKISVAELFDGPMQLSEKRVLHLMNIVIQLRKVCNHPELFERNEGQIFYLFASLPHALAPPPFGQLEDVYYAGHRNPISYQLPKLLYRDSSPCLPPEASGALECFHQKWLYSQLSIFSPDNVHHSLYSSSRAKNQIPTCTEDWATSCRSSTFSAMHLMGLAVADIAAIARCSALERWLICEAQAQAAETTLSFVKDTAASRVLEGGKSLLDERRVSSLECGPSASAEEEEELPSWQAVRKLLRVPERGSAQMLREKRPGGVWGGPGGAPPVFEALVNSLEDRMLAATGLLRAVQGYHPSVLAPLVDVWCSDRSFAHQRQEQLQEPWSKRLLLGQARLSEEGGGPMRPLPRHPLVEECLQRQEEDEQPLLAVTHRIMGSGPPMHSFDFAKMLTDSGKLQLLDSLLGRLRAEGHRVLLFAQMTKMLNILEDYMNYRKYRYLRLDGSSSITDRRDMVKDFQQRQDIFVFLLSTRAGGLGINLTAADTVIFYESDWNPTMDLQAMDRAHRLGQTREVTVYRLICEGTVEEKIVKRAGVKHAVQQLVMTGGQAQADVFDAEEVVSLLLDDEELEQQMTRQGKGTKAPEKSRRKRGSKGGGPPKGVRLDAEGSAFLEEVPGVDAASTAPVVAATEPPVDGQAETQEPSSRQGSAGGADLDGVAAAAPPKRKRKPRAEGKPPKPPKAPRPPRPPGAKPMRIRLPPDPSKRKRVRAKPVYNGRDLVAEGDSAVVDPLSASVAEDAAGNAAIIAGLNEGHVENGNGHVTGKPTLALSEEAGGQEEAPPKKRRRRTTAKAEQASMIANGDVAQGSTGKGSKGKASHGHTPSGGVELDATVAPDEGATEMVPKQKGSGKPPRAVGRPRSSRLPKKAKKQEPPGEQQPSDGAG